MQIWLQLIYIEITYLHFSHVWQRATQETILFRLISSRFLLPIASLSLSLYASHKAVPTIGSPCLAFEEASKATPLRIKATEMQLRGQRSPSPPQVFQDPSLVRPPFSPALAQGLQDRLPRVFWGGAPCFHSCGKRAAQLFSICYGGLAELQ